MPLTLPLLMMTFTDPLTPPTISREVKRSSGASSGYEAVDAALSCRARRRRGLVKLREGTALRPYALGHIRLARSPQQISGKLKGMSHPDESHPDANGPCLPVVGHETLCHAIDAIARG